MEIKNIDIEDFATEVVNALKSYTEDVEEGISEEVKKVGNDAVQKLQSVVLPSETETGTNTKASKRRNWNNYSKSWENNFEENANYSKSIVHNRKHYQLTHLLEYGHATKNGGRTRAFEHIKPVSDEAEKTLLDNVEKVIKKGGKL